MRSLHATLPTEGSVIAFNSSFEIGRLRECCELLPEFQPWVTNIESRIVDLLVPFRRFDYYDSMQHGSASMKSVFPALTGKGYEGLAIQKGDMASREFLRVTFGEVDENERQRVRQALEEYCGLDTMGMILIVEALRKLVRETP